MCQHKFRPSTYHCPEDPEGPRSSGPSRLFCAQQAPCSKSRKSVLLSVVLMSCSAGLTHTHKKHPEQHAMGLSATLRPTASDLSFHLLMWGGVVTKAGEGAHSARGLGRTRPPGIYTCIYATWDCKDATDDDGRGRAGRRAREEENLAFFAWAIKAFTIMSEHGMFSCLARSLPHIVGLL